MMMADELITYSNAVLRADWLNKAAHVFFMQVKSVLNGVKHMLLVSQHKGADLKDKLDAMRILGAVENKCRIVRQTAVVIQGVDCVVTRLANAANISQALKVYKTTSTPCTRVSITTLSLRRLSLKDPSTLTDPSVTRFPPPGCFPLFPRGFSTGAVFSAAGPSPLERRPVLLDRPAFLGELLDFAIALPLSGIVSLIMGGLAVAWIWKSFRPPSWLSLGHPRAIQSF